MTIITGHEPVIARVLPGDLLRGDVFLTARGEVFTAYGRGVPNLLTGDAVIPVWDPRFATYYVPSNEPLRLVARDTVGA